VDLFNYRIGIYPLIIFLFFSCESENTNEIPEINDFYLNNVAAFYADYNSSNHTLSVYMEFLDVLNNIDSISGVIKNNDITFYEFELENQEVNSKVYLIEDILINDNNNPILSENIFLYNLEITIIFSDNSIYTFNNDLTTSIAPNIMDITIPSTIQIDQTEWTVLDLRIFIKDLNSLNNIENVKYEIKRTLLNGCDTECIFDENCNEDIIEENYISDDTWIFNYTESLSDTTFIYDEEILLRPIDGSAYYNNDEIIFEQTDCGRTGIIEFKFIVQDRDGLKDEVEGVLLELIE
tara:strand:- start:10434 stop:11315 length:882 start_codon:yes stop_codon:yes gene_type:complete